MKREILFRGKRIDNDEWVEGYLIENASESYICPNQLEFDIDYYKSLTITDYYEVNPDTAGQFTGMLDKNGKKIFEGDIGLSDRGIEGVVTFSNGTFKWDGDLLGYDFCDSGIESCSTDDWFTIIGNIHDKI